MFPVHFDALRDGKDRRHHPEPHEAYTGENALGLSIFGKELSFFATYLGFGRLFLLRQEKAQAG